MQDVSVIAETVTVNVALVGGVAGASVSVATAVSTTIPITGRVIKVSASAATTSASCTLAAGTYDGQTVCLVNESANNIVISGNMMGAAAATVSGSQGAQFVWTASDTKWFVCKG